MMTRTEKLFCIRAQVQKATAEIEHGDTYQSCLALADALIGVVKFLEEEDSAPIVWPAPEKLPIRPASDPETRAALDTLRAEPIRSKRR